jgi:hypothetical protein
LQILFVDESGTPPPPSRQGEDSLFVLGGIVVPEDYWSKLAADLRRLKEHYSIEGEIKWRHFAVEKPQGKQHSLSHLTSAHKEELRTKLYQTIGAYKSIRLICVATNASLAYRQPYIHNADDLYWYSYKQLTERFQYYLQDLQRTVGQHVNGIIVCDHRAPKDDIRLRELHQQLLDGNKWTYSSYQNLIEGLFIAPSHLSIGIQFADMVAGAVFRNFKAKDSRYFKQIEGSFRKSPTGKLDGFGLVKWPKTGW